MFYRKVAFAALLAVLPVAAQAASTVITFDNFDTSGAFGGNGKPITSYAEGGFSFSLPAGQYQQYTGAGNSLLTGAYNTTENAQLTITGPAQFVFSSFQASNSIYGASFTVTGYLGDAIAYSYSGVIPVQTVGQSFDTYANLFSANVDRVTLGTDAQGQLLLDNFTFGDATAEVPEPASWAMMIAGFGLTGAAMRRRKVAVSFA